jgi:hypothetical protein
MRDPYNPSFGYDKGAFQLGCSYFSGCIYAEDAAEIEINIQHPERVGSEYVIEYWVKVQEDESKEVWKKVVAWRELYEFNIEISAKPKSKDGRWYAGYFKDTYVWFALGTVVWDRAVTDPDNPSKHADNVYNIPIDAFVVYVMDEPYPKRGDSEGYVEPTPEMKAYAQIVPEAGGRRITLYDSPSVYANPLEYFMWGDLNKTLAGDPRPDSRFEQVAYFNIQLKQFGTYIEKDNTWYGLAGVTFYYPVKTIRVRVVYLRFGEFIYTYDKDTEPPPTWTTETPAVITTTPPKPNILPDFSWLSWDNPLTWIILAAAGIVLLVLLLIAAGFASAYVGRLKR